MTLNHSCHKTSFIFITYVMKVSCQSYAHPFKLLGVNS